MEPQIVNHIILDSQIMETLFSERASAIFVVDSSDIVM
ncbi:hypothetical protein AALP_AA2G043400 [Arabis alpina]|uniref:Uncharacterized protein n=1 Tax=Arabis alpina TaxID=50452 RepID=A0A087HFA4_ARAAL|nr:hypothetical protein AALP_AA2G043400 [Arabis alpina]